MVPTITGLPRRRGSCLRADTVVLSSLWREGHRITSHIRHPSVEEVGSALSHTSGISPWRGCAPHYPTHWASAHGGDGHRIIPHIGHQLVEGMGTVSFHTSGRHCPDPDGSCVMAGCPPKGPHHMITRGSCSVYTHAALQLVGGSRLGSPSRWEQVESAISVFNMVLFSQALFWCIGAQVVSLC